MTTKLTDMGIRALPFEAGQKDYPDDAVRGMFLRVGVRSKSFMLTVRQGTKRQRVTLGHYPFLSLSKARERTRDLLAEARLRPAENPPTFRFSEAFDTFQRLHLPTMRPGTRYECERMLRGYFLPELAARPLNAITTPMLAAILDRIEKPAERRNAFVWIRAFLGWHASRGHLDLNPASRLKGLSASKSRDRVLTDAELIAVWNAAPQDNFGAFVRLLLLTGQRRGQWHAFRPEFIEGDTIVFPGSVMKQGKPHTIPLTPTIRRLIGNHTFTGFNVDHRKAKLQRDTGTSGWTWHDCRRTVATRLCEAPLSVAPHLVSRLLAHAQPGVMGRYNRASYISELRDALERWDGYLAQLIDQ